MQPLNHQSGISQEEINFVNLTPHHISREKIKFVNLTAHPILEMSSNMEFKTSGVVARVNTIQKNIFTTHTGISITKTVYDSIIGLPDPKNDTFFIVSAAVINALKENNIQRDDVVAPNKIIRNNHGIVIGCIGFRMNG